jgi:hypothetical protein
MADSLETQLLTMEKIFWTSRLLLMRRDLIYPITSAAKNSRGWPVNNRHEIKDTSLRHE